MVSVPSLEYGPSIFLKEAAGEQRLLHILHVSIIVTILSGVGGQISDFRGFVFPTLRTAQREALLTRPLQLAVDIRGPQSAARWALPLGHISALWLQFTAKYQ